MAKMSYAEQLKHPNWQRKRLQMLEAADWACNECGCKDTTLHVHHKKYVKGRMAWEYENTELDVLCERCHESTHKGRDWLEHLMSLGNEDIRLTRLGVGIMAGMAAALQLDADPEVLNEVYRAHPRYFALGFLLGAVGPTGLAHAAEAHVDSSTAAMLQPMVDAVLGKVE